MATKLKFSEAIRLGAMMIPKQCWNMLFHFADSDPNVPTHACALGAARRAGWSEHGESRRFIDRDVLCPACRRRRLVLTAAVTHLNDDHYWTREQIADWVETQEQETTDGKAGSDDQSGVVVAENVEAATR